MNFRNGCNVAALAGALYATFFPSSVWAEDLQEYRYFEEPTYEELYYYEDTEPVYIDDPQYTPYLEEPVYGEYPASSPYPGEDTTYSDYYECAVPDEYGDSEQELIWLPCEEGCDPRTVKAATKRIRKTGESDADWKKAVAKEARSLLNAKSCPNATSDVCKVGGADGICVFMRAGSPKYQGRLIRKPNPADNEYEVTAAKSCLYRCVEDEQF